MHCIANINKNKQNTRCKVNVRYEKLAEENRRINLWWGNDIQMSNCFCRSRFENPRENRTLPFGPFIYAFSAQSLFTSRLLLTVTMPKR